MNILRPLGFLLTYPSLSHQIDAGSCRQEICGQAVLSDSVKGRITLLAGHLLQKELLDLQEDYVDLFDRTPSLSLHLFEHVHGDSRERGQALADLNNLYLEAGLVIATEEMPDYLPLFLEYLSTRPPSEAKDHLASVAYVLAAIGGRLKHRGAPYACIFDALCEIAGQDIREIDVARALKQDSGDPLAQEDLDRVWTEQFAFENAFGADAPQQACPIASDMVRRMNAHLTPDLSVQERTS